MQLFSRRWKKQRASTHSHWNFNQKPSAIAFTPTDKITFYGSSHAARTSKTSPVSYESMNGYANRAPETFSIMRQTEQLEGALGFHHISQTHPRQRTGKRNNKFRLTFHFINSSFLVSWTNMCPCLMMIPFFGGKSGSPRVALVSGSIDQHFNP